MKRRKYDALTLALSTSPIISHPDQVKMGRDAAVIGADLVKEPPWRSGGV